MRAIPINARVECTDGHCGTSTTIIVNPITREVTHVVVEDQAGVQRLVGLDQVQATTAKWMRLDCSTQELEAMPPFVETHFLVEADPEADPSAEDQVRAPTYVSPYVMPVEGTYAQMEVEHVPEGEMALHRGATVEAVDGFVGKVEQFVVDPDRGTITHLVLQEGHLWGKKAVTIPLSAVDRFQDETVYLKLDQAAIQQLPAVPMKRPSITGEPAIERLELVARVFEDTEGASSALEFLRDLQKTQKHVIKVRNAAVLVKDAEGNTTLRELAEEKDTKRGRLLGAVAGGLVGMAAGPVGAVIGAAVGFGAGSFATAKIDAGFSQAFLTGLLNRLKPGTSALVVLVEDEWMEPLSEAWAGLEGTVFQQTLSDQLVQELLPDQENVPAAPEAGDADQDP